MKLPLLAPPDASLLWLDAHRVVAGTHRRPLNGTPTEDQLAQALAALPPGPTRWVVEDLWTPSVLMRDLTELPRGAEAQEAFFKWRFTQALALETPHFVQALEVEPGAWLASGIREDLRESMLQLSLRLDRTVHTLTPRWLYLYNLLAPSLALPGMLLSLSPVESGRYAGTLVAWGRTLCLLRQWSEPLDAEGWMEERIAPSAAFLQRESRPPQQLFIWGAPAWPDSGLATKLMDDRLVFGESR
ncbi:hypothetical protein GETHLI_31130 [Geothrix limicola]|uniref:Uncharacterized protein n=1 Tax=Geothrix limicola TaxID=2927978 RepID=A0ABQ5QJ65_9BACT|nr:hypothetical protein [Geothrix limicola]GLH74611.1 hypothetical protein GETHLI_31130 [Geothrix limicola]